MSLNCRYLLFITGIKTLNYFWMTEPYNNISSNKKYHFIRKWRNLPAIAGHGVALPQNEAIGLP
jgi:hypothetical protein